MKRIFYILTLFIFSFSCTDSKYTPFVFIHLENPLNADLQSDYEQHLDGVKQFLFLNSIPFSENQADLSKTKFNFTPINFDTTGFFIILFDVHKLREVIQTFGTDIDLISDIKKYYSIQ